MRMRQRRIPNALLGSSNSAEDGEAPRPDQSWRNYILATVGLTVAVAVLLNAVYRIFSSFPGVRSNGGFSAAEGLSAASDSIATVLGVAVALAGSWVAISLARQANNQADISMSLEKKIKEQNDFALRESNFEKICTVLEDCHSALERVDTSARVLQSEVQNTGSRNLEGARSELQDNLKNAAAQLRQIYIHPILGKAWQVSSARGRNSNWLPLMGGGDHGNKKNSGGEVSDNIDWESVLEGASKELREFVKDKAARTKLDALVSYTEKSFFTPQAEGFVSGTVPDAVKRHEDLSMLAPYVFELEEYFSGCARAYALIAHCLASSRIETGSPDLIRLMLNLGIVARSNREVTLGNFREKINVGSDGSVQRNLVNIWRNLAEPLIVIDAFSAWARMLGEIPVDKLCSPADSFLASEGDDKAPHSETQFIRERVLSYYSALAVGAWTRTFALSESNVKSSTCEARSEEAKSETDRVRNGGARRNEMTVDLGTLTLASLTLCLPRIDDITRQSRERLSEGYDIHLDPNKIRAIAYLLDTICAEMKAGLEASPRYLFRLE